MDIIESILSELPDSLLQSSIEENDELKAGFYEFLLQKARNSMYEQLLVENKLSKVKRKVSNKWKELFKEYDGVILPVSSGPAKKLENNDDSLDEATTVLEEHLQIGNFGGFPSITIPDGFINDLPVALNITGNCYDDENVLNIAYHIESMLGYKNQTAKEVNNG